MGLAEDDPRAAAAALAACRAPLLIGVRHHSAALARALPALLAAARPRVLLVELPSDFDPWLPWVAHPQAEAPLALAAVTRDGQRQSFLPFADFSPELVALRWGLAHGVPLHGIDLPSDRRTERDAPADMSPVEAEREPPAALRALTRLAGRHGLDDPHDLWERLVEDADAGDDPEALRRAALTFGWMWRAAGPLSPYDARREAWMRRRIAELGGDGAVALVGSYHAAALLPGVWEPSVEASARLPEDAPTLTALMPYGFAQFDARSGYPAGVLDPAWHQAALACADGAGRHRLAAEMAVAVCRHLRVGRHLASAADAAAVARLAGDLATLRGLPAPGRGELVEAVQSALVRGEPLGAGRAVAAALHATLVGHRRGRLPPGCPRSGLEPHVEELLVALGLPGPADAHREPRELRLEPLGGDLDRLRAVTLARLVLLGVDYATPVAGIGGIAGDAALGERWTVAWSHATSAGLVAASPRGPTLEMAAAGALAADLVRAGDGRDQEPTPAERLAAAETAARCGLTGAAARLLDVLHGAEFLAAADLMALVTAGELLRRVALGQLAGLPPVAVARAGMLLPAFPPPGPEALRVVEQAAERLLEGLGGSDRIEDVHALLALAQAQAADGEPPGLRIAHLLRRFAVQGGPLMQGAASGLLALGDAQQAAGLGSLLGSWLAGAGDAGGRGALQRRWAGLLLAGAPLLEGAPELLDDPHRVLAAFPDQEFLDRLPALRAGSEALDPDGRRRLLRALLARIAPGAEATIAGPALALAQVAAADLAGRAATEWLDGGTMPAASDTTAVAPATGGFAPAAGTITAADRWRLVLGQPPSESGAMAAAAGSALAACHGGGKGGRVLIAPSGGGGGDEAAKPDVRTWDEDLVKLFSSDVREEVLAERSRTTPAALELLDPARATPSVELLERILSLRGGMPAGAASPLRALAKRIVAELARQLARRLRPALGPLGLPRPARRGRQLDLRRTVRANLAGVVMEDDGPRLAARRLVFRSRAARTMDWHLILVVDSSGSMEASVVHAALCASVFNALPALSVRFLTVNTAVVDLSGRVDDPLELLLEVSVGGGTHLALGLHRARQEMRVPSRTMVVLVSDFEEGVSVGQLLAEVRALATTGARCLGLAALDARGQPRYHAGIAAQVAAAGMPVAALGPEQLAKWVGERMR